MSSNITTNSTRSNHRAQIVAEAVVSAYIHEIAPPRRRPEPSRARGGWLEPARAVAHPVRLTRARRRPIAPRRPAALEARV